MAFSERAVVLLGILELSDHTNLKTPTTQPIFIEQKDHWLVEHHEELAVWRCQCGRSDPLFVPQTDMKKVRLPNDLIKACEVCRKEFEFARGKTGHLQAWLERNRFTINKDEHLYLPSDLGYCRDRDNDRSMKTKRFVYEVFWKKKLGSKHFVRSMCSDDSCINPYHLCLATSPAAKVTKPVRFYIQKLASQGVSAKTTQLLLRDQLSLELSLRSIQLIRSDVEKLESLVA